MYTHSNNIEFFTVKEAAQKLRCCTKTVLIRIKQKALRAVPNGRNYIISREALEEFAKRGTGE
jgi:excisionase family DNA binding protein